MKDRRDTPRALARLILSLTLLVGLLAPLAAQSNGIVPLLYVAERDDAVFYIYGSIHAAPPEAIPPPVVVREAFDRSALLVTEIPMSDDLFATMTMQMMELMFYPDGESLRDLFSPNEWRQVVSWASSAGIPPDMIGQMRPWAASLMVAESAPVPPGFSVANGLDLYFGNKGTARRMSNVGLETLDEQIALLSAGTEEEQAAALLEAIEQVATATQTIDLYAAWRDGDALAIEDLILEGIGDAESEAYQQLLTIRNRNWAQTMSEELSDATGPVFVVVGAAHLVGQDSLLELLRGEGFAVRRVMGNEGL